MSEVINTAAAAAERENADTMLHVLEEVDHQMHTMNRVLSTLKRIRNTLTSLGPREDLRNVCLRLDALLAWLWTRIETHELCSEKLMFDLTPQQVQWLLDRDQGVQLGATDPPLPFGDEIVQEECRGDQQG